VWYTDPLLFFVICSTQDPTSSSRLSWQCWLEMRVIPRQRAIGAVTSVCTRQRWGRSGSFPALWGYGPRLPSKGSSRLPKFSQNDGPCSGSALDQPYWGNTRLSCTGACWHKPKCPPSFRRVRVMFMPRCRRFRWLQYRDFCLRPSFSTPGLKRRPKIKTLPNPQMQSCLDTDGP
jgi:hypothetical protein